jgi:RimJ/RimL family protein N-acetyltransferase
MKEQLKTERLLLRRWTPEDAQTLYLLASDPEIGPAAGWPVHTSVENSLSVIRDVLDRDGTYAVIRRSDGLLVGSTGLRFGKDSCSGKEAEPELGYWIGRPYWGNGYAPEAAAALLACAFGELHCPKVWCCYYEGNRKSERVTQKLGFSYVRTDPKGETLLGYTLPEVETVIPADRWAPARGEHAQSE